MTLARKAKVRKESQHDTQNNQIKANEKFHNVSIAAVLGILPDIAREIKVSVYSVRNLSRQCNQLSSRHDTNIMIGEIGNISRGGYSDD